MQAGRAGRYGETASPSKMDSPRSGGKALGYGVGKGNVLGRGDEGGDGEGGGSGEEGKEGFRQQLHSKWEADKKTQKRLDYYIHISFLRSIYYSSFFSFFAI